MGVQERRAREREARRRSVLDATRALVRERGFTGTTTRRIAERCELSEATVFWYFKNKDEIFTSLLFEGIEFMRKGLDAIAAEGLDDKTRIERLWAFFTQVDDTHPEFFHVFSYLAHPRSTASVSDAIRDDLAQKSGYNLRRFAEMLGSRGEGDRGRVTVDVIWSTFLGLMMLRDSRVNLGAPGHPDSDDLRQAFELLWSGIGS